MKITISGASGFIGRRLVKSLLADGHSVQVLSRHAGTNMPPNVRVFAWDAEKAPAPADSLNGVDAVVHLAGEPVAQRWNEGTKQRIRDSRVAGTRNLVEAFGKVAKSPGVLVCSSAVGYYGSRGDEVLTEDSPPGNGFLADVCKGWEQEAMRAEAFGTRVARVRTGVVLDPRGGALRKMLPPFRLGAGGRLGDGRQWMSWIHIDDLVGIFRMAVDKPVSGAINGTAPYPATNAEFTKLLAAALHRPAVFPVPGVALRLLFGEMSQMLLGGQRVLPKAAETAGYRFQFPQLGPALAHLLKV